MNQTRTADDPKRFLPLRNLSFHILLALGAGRAHGYAIGKDLEARSEGKLNPTTGALYQSLKKLEETGLIERVPDDASTDSRRKCFGLTALGRRVASEEAGRLHGLVAEARRRDLFSQP